MLNVKITEEQRQIQQLFGIEMKSIRLRLGFAQKDVAAVMRTHQSSYTLMESGRRRLTVPTLIRIAKAFKMPLQEILMIYVECQEKVLNSKFDTEIMVVRNENN